MNSNEYGAVETVKILKDIIGVVFDEVRLSDESDNFSLKNHNMEVNFFHPQNCCESVEFEFIEGELFDLFKVPILSAEIITHECIMGDTLKYTFLKLRTIKDSVTIQCRGESNGYYSMNIKCSITETRVL